MQMPAIGLYYYKARIYDPNLGRFLQTDPLGYSQGMNLYAYVLNDPANNTDPSGMDMFCGVSESINSPVLCSAEEIASTATRIPCSNSASRFGSSASPCESLGSISSSVPSGNNLGGNQLLQKSFPGSFVGTNSSASTPNSAWQCARQSVVSKNGADLAIALAGFAAATNPWGSAAVATVDMLHNGIQGDVGGSSFAALDYHLAVLEKPLMQVAPRYARFIPWYGLATNATSGFNALKEVSSAYDVCRGR